MGDNRAGVIIGIIAVVFVALLLMAAAKFLGDAIEKAKERAGHG